MNNNTIKFKKLRSDAIIPSKADNLDSGYDVSILGVHKDMGNTKLYSTGISVTPPKGYYLELVPRSSIVKYGYMLKNGVGIIDQTYTGEILVALIKVDSSAPDLEFPLKIVQLIPKEFHHFETEEVDGLEKTNRGSGGFGSTDEK